MNHPSALPSSYRAQPARSRRGNRTRLFYAGAACVMLIAVLIGFRHFFLQGRAHPGRELTPKSAL